MTWFAPLNSEPEPLLQQIEVATFFQLPSFQIIGLPSPEVAEARERVRSAIDASGFEFPKRRVIINLSPACIRKRGTGIDLAIALAVLDSTGSRTDRVAAWGELGLDGTVKPSGQLTRCLFAAWQGEITEFLVSQSEYSQAMVALRRIQQSRPLKHPPPSLVPVKTLQEAWNFFNPNQKKERIKQLEDNLLIPPASLEPVPSESLEAGFSLLALNPAMERMMSVVVSGGHHLLLLGPKGVGKTQTIEWALALQPQISAEDRLQRSLIAELGEGSRTSPARLISLSDTGSDWKHASPARRVSAHVRPPALIGGANAAAIYPGEFSLAHGGMLVADELPEWPRDSREALREPLERGLVTLTRSQGALEMPARFQLIASGNFCPCGGWPPELPLPTDGGDFARTQKSLRCRCAHSVREGYLSKLSGPILDRFDVVLIVTQASSGKNTPPAGPEKIRSLRKQVFQSRSRMIEKWGGLPGHLSGVELEKWIQLHPPWIEFLEELSIGSLRSRHKIARMALSLAAWDGLDCPEKAHFLEASHYRAERLSLFN